jgi:hypothetical protein
VQGPFQPEVGAYAKDHGQRHSHGDGLHSHG